MFRPIPLWLLLLSLVTGVVVMIGFGGLVLHPPRQTLVRESTLWLANIPSVLKKTVKSVTKIPRSYAPSSYDERLPEGLWRNPDQPFVDDGYVLVRAFDENLKRSVVRLISLRDGTVVHQYAPDIRTMNSRSTFVSPLIDVRRDRDARRNLMMHPLLMPDGGIVIHDSSPLARFDACGHMEWMIDGIFHHSLERDGDGNLWAPFRYPKAKVPDVGPLFEDESIMKVSPDGKILHEVRIADILDSNQLGWLWRGRPYTDDPFHLNDVQPVLKSGPYWLAGDLFISLRNLSLVMLYRPSTGKVLWWRSNFSHMQHDVSIIDDHRIAVFDNNWRVAAPEGEVDGFNRVAVYDFATDSASYPLDDAMKKLRVHTRAQGRATPLPNGDFMIEETEGGRLMRVAPDGAVRWRYIAATPSMRRLELRWSRYVDPASNQEAITLAKDAKCN
ncbi:arylsulfotransferase family protein [Acetobacter sicerae]|uniref:arylsulfotransferase family protein n=1 Tax=Acetobacter sicerae TaxID=85325 RepID=UPI00156B30C1|nr:arylsulfotransferase family protein [Acetobacter sicerae]NHN91198.1 PQQ-binding-like beta-propeller repeat protein [Acetobacter sicerae]